MGDSTYRAMGQKICGVNMYNQAKCISALAYLNIYFFFASTLHVKKINCCGYNVLFWLTALLKYERIKANKESIKSFDNWL